MVYPLQTIASAIVLAAYAIQSIHLMLVKLFRQCTDIYTRWQASDRIKLVLEFNTTIPEPS